MSAFNTSVGGNHYESNSIQPIDFILANHLDWNEANAVKYICRHRRKNGAEDVRKAIHYLEMLLERQYGETYFNDTEPARDAEPTRETTEPNFVSRVRLSDESNLRIQALAERGIAPWSFWGLLEDYPSRLR